MLLTTNGALLISVFRREEPELTEETFGFQPTVMISFEEANDALNECHANMVRAVDWNGKQLDGDLVFLANRDVPAILRRDGHIWLRPEGLFLNAAGPSAPDLPLRMDDTAQVLTPGNSRRLHGSAHPTPRLRTADLRRCGLVGMIEAPTIGAKIAHARAGVGHKRTLQTFPDHVLGMRAAIERGKRCIDGAPAGRADLALDQNATLGKYEIRTTAATFVLFRVVRISGGGLCQFLLILGL